MKLIAKHHPGEPGRSIEIDLDALPSMVAGPDDGQISLNWDQALDDENVLRHCVVCGCDQLYLTRGLPRLWPLGSILLGLGLLFWIPAHFLWLVFIGLGVAMLILDQCLKRIASRSLTCYRCGSNYSEIPILPEHPTWSRQLAKRLERPS